MIKNIIFDLDGVLVDARELHYEALNAALGKFGYKISRHEHLSTYDGLPTKKKMEILTQKKGLPVDLYEDIWRLKQGATLKIIDQTYKPDERLRGLLRKLKTQGYRLAVCSNSIGETIKMVLIRKGLMEFIDFYISNEEVRQPKPHPEMYLSAILRLGARPRECLVVEDSHHGREAAQAAGAQVLGVRNVSDVTEKSVLTAIEKANQLDNGQPKKPKWQGGNLRIIVPLAGEGKSFRRAGYTFPKPLVEIQGKPMVQWVVENLNAEAKYIFIVKQEHYEKYNLKYLLRLIAPGSEIIPLKKATRGAAETVLAAKKYLNNNHPAVVVNGDQYMEWNSNEFFYAMAADECDGGIVTFESMHPKWSFVKTGKDGFVKRAAEKKPISNQATAGVYYFKKGRDLLKYGQQMIKKKIMTNGEFYVCPIYNEMIKAGKKVRAFPIDNVWSFATPEDLKSFLQAEEPLHQNGKMAIKVKSKLDNEGLGKARVTAVMRRQVIQAPATIKVVIPMAGAGSRFVNAGYKVPKPFIEVNGKPMVEHVLENMQIPGAEYIVIARTEHLEQKRAVMERLQARYRLKVVEVDKLTEGPACTVLLASQLINDNTPLLLANSDQLVDIKMTDFVNDCGNRHLDGSILTFWANHPKWSYAKVNKQGRLLETREKVVISNQATVGIYLFARGCDFVSAAAEMISLNDRANNEFYVAPVYNYLVKRGLNIGIYEIAEALMHGLGTPEDLQEFIKGGKMPEKLRN